MFAACAIGSCWAQSWGGRSRPRSSLTEQITIEQTDTEASSSGLRRRFGRHRSSCRARREPEVEPTQGSTAGRPGETLLEFPPLRADHFDPKFREPPPSLELRHEVLRRLLFAALRDGLLAAGLTTQGDREALGANLELRHSYAAQEPFSRIRARPEHTRLNQCIRLD